MSPFPPMYTVLWFTDKLKGNDEAQLDTSPSFLKGEPVEIGNLDFTLAMLLVKLLEKSFTWFPYSR